MVGSPQRSGDGGGGRPERNSTLRPGVPEVRKERGKSKMVRLNSRILILHVLTATAPEPGQWGIKQ